MPKADPLKVLLESLPSDLYETFVDELNNAITDVCALARNPDQAGNSIVALAELIRSWHLTVALSSNEAWVKAMQEDIECQDDEIGTFDDLRKLLAS